MLVLFFFSAEAMTQPQNSDMYVQYIYYSFSILLMLLQGQGCNVLFGTVFFFFFSLLENGAA